MILEELVKLKIELLLIIKYITAKELNSRNLLS